MKKQSGFTLIELMVVMAIIAILATAGLSAYTGYIKKARDTTRIADIHAINTIVLGAMWTIWTAPAIADLRTAILAANNNQNIEDPLGGKEVCLYRTMLNGNSIPCQYLYYTCNNGLWYLLAASLESTSNISLLEEDGSGAEGASSYLEAWTDVFMYYGRDIYDIGSCSWSGVDLNPLDFSEMGNYII